MPKAGADDRGTEGIGDRDQGGEAGDARVVQASDRQVQAVVGHRTGVGADELRIGVVRGDVQVDGGDLGEGDLLGACKAGEQECCAGEVESSHRGLNQVELRNDSVRVSPGNHGARRGMLTLSTV